MLCGMWPTACCYRECFFFRLVKFSGFDSLTGMTGSNICFKSDQDEFKDLTALVSLAPKDQGAVNKYFNMKDKTLELVEEADVSNKEKNVLHFEVLTEEGVGGLGEKEYKLTKSADDNTWTVLRAEKCILGNDDLHEILKNVGGKVVIGDGVSCAEAHFLVDKDRVVAMYQRTFLNLYDAKDKTSLNFFGKGNFIATNQEDD
eukprot:GHVS01024082.1.p1 GENE.GHVS01024082.1~~GHVS01024082.1.p1  ORF type:complete len:202 (-),score=20.88 GHVS01024082.1:78-683(-)